MLRTLFLLFFIFMVCRPVVKHWDALFGSGERENAIDELLTLFKRDRDWNEQAARKQLVKFFEAMGPTDPLTLSGRRRLSAQMFS